MWILYINIHYIGNGNCMLAREIEKLNNVVIKQYCFENGFDLTDSLRVSGEVPRSHNNK